MFSSIFYSLDLYSKKSVLGMLYADLLLNHRQYITICEDAHGKFSGLSTLAATNVVKVSRGRLNGLPQRHETDL